MSGLRIAIISGLLVLLTGSSAVSAPLPAAAPKADWTIMVYMNAKNNLEPAGITNFLQMAQVGSTDRVNILVELGRPEKTRYTKVEGNWTGVLRFRVEKSMHPIPASAIDPDNLTVRHADMGSGAVLADFVQWAELNYPAKKTMLLIWNHGQGWRLYLSKTGTFKARLPSAQVSAIGVKGMRAAASPADRPLLGGFRSVSFDDDTQNFLYNRDIQNSLSGRHLDVIGFDACLMGMIESAYAFRGVAKVMVASEELIPNDGWKYDSWMQDVLKNPEMDAFALGRDLVESYKNTYKDTGNMTLSAVDLAQTEQTRTALATLSMTIQANLVTEAPNLELARKASQNYGDWYGDSWQNCRGSDVLRFHGIDLDHFLVSYRGTTHDANIQKQIDVVRQLVAGMILSSYSSAASAGEKYWSTGLAIYFPGSKVDFQCDSDGDGYDVPNVRNGTVKFPPEFVEKQGWADLVYAYLQTPTAAAAALDY